jgi:hypothetical protein
MKNTQYTFGGILCQCHHMEKEEVPKQATYMKGEAIVKKR